MDMSLDRPRRDAAKRQILGILQDSTKSNARIPSTKKEHVELMCEDLDDQLNVRHECLKSIATKGKEHQNQIHKQGMVKIKKAIRGMSVKEFNQTHECDLLELIYSIAGHHQTKKRVRPENLETPAPKQKGKSAFPTTARTVRRGEAMFSENGSPVDAHDEGALIATVSKKRRGNSAAATMFEINVGNGNYIDLSNPENVNHLDDNMKDVAESQVKVLQEQLASLMAQLKK
eukprot:CAMPEP_0202452662 /NCGR_PEP_ID=MMETSP1360-20130828/10816_1 /ASSEMBLY_ACC=CAM_ASM_000848 /TAXON_ID=515479 /ORGANISM="Licmophora paradoxa, Strain CCMP2313" /LENGTH=230 /DNA_ID=CAMNT_0049071541 /DNA_START=111 /DNA_END=803 /DNA_ORIENTATION=+